MRLKDILQGITAKIEQSSVKGPNDNQRNKILAIVLGIMLFVCLILCIILMQTKQAVPEQPMVSDSQTHPSDEQTPESEPERTPVPTEEPEPEETPMPTEEPLEDGETLLAAPDGSLDEYQNAAWKHWSETMFVTIQEQTTQDGNPFLLTHVIIKTPSQMQLRTAGENLNGTRQTLTAYAEQNTFVLGINASEATNSYSQIRPGAYICSGQILQDMETTGNELCIGEDGSLSSAQPGLSPQQLIDSGIMHSAISAGPVLIQNTEAVSGLNATVLGTKTAIAMKQPGEYYIITASDGDYISDVSYQDIQEVFLSLECQYAKCLGDGAEVVLVMNGQLINNPAAGGSQRSLLDFLIFLD